MSLTMTEYPGRSEYYLEQPSSEPPKAAQEATRQIGREWVKFMLGMEGVGNATCLGEVGNDGVGTNSAMAVITDLKTSGRSKTTHPTFGPRKWKVWITSEFKVKIITGPPEQVAAVTKKAGLTADEINDMLLNSAKA